MHRSFILFTKQELNIPALLGTSSGMTTFLGVTISKIALIGTKSADAGRASTGDVCASGACIRGFCTKGSFAGGASIVDASIGNACAKGACVGVRNLMS